MVLKNPAIPHMGRTFRLVVLQYRPLIDYFEWHEKEDKVNIDLFLGPYGESGLLCDRIPDEAVAGVIFDAQTLELTLEFTAEAETLHLNIPVEDGYRDPMLFSHKIYIGMLRDGLIAETLIVPMLYLNDPYGSDFGQGSPIGKTRRSLIGFEQFMKRSTAAQPVHREDLGDKDSIGCVLRGMNPHALEFVPQLVRQRMLETGPRAIPQLAGVVRTPTGPGGMGGGTSAARQAMSLRPRTPTKKDKE
jgi:hypothetical protein